jgi:hypothetical protein
MYKLILQNISKHIALENEEADYFTGLISFRDDSTKHSKKKFTNDCLRKVT